MLGVSAVLLGDGALKVSTTLTASCFSCDVLPQTDSPLQARSIILKDWLHKNLDRASVFNVSIPASSCAAFKAGWAVTARRTAASKTMFLPWQIASTAGFTILHFAFLAATGIHSVPCMVTDHGTADDDIAAAGVIIIAAVAIVAAFFFVVLILILLVVLFFVISLSFILF
jgi:hypothetical protein